MRCLTTKLAANIPAALLFAFIPPALPSSGLLSKCINLKDERVLVFRLCFIKNKKQSAYAGVK